MSSAIGDTGEASSDIEDSDAQGPTISQHADDRDYYAHLKDFSSSTALPKAKAEPKPLHTADDLAQAVEEARHVTAERVEAELRVAMANDREQRRCEALTAIRNYLDRRQSAYDEEFGRLAEASHRLALALAKVMVPKATEKHPLADIKEVVKNTLLRLADEPFIELRLPPGLADCRDALIADLSEGTGFKGEVKAITDPDLGNADVELRWNGGGIDRRAERLHDEAIHIVDFWLSKQPEMSSEEKATPMPVASENTPRRVTSDPENKIHEQVSEPSHEC